MDVRHVQGAVRTLFEKGSALGRNEFCLRLDVMAYRAGESSTYSATATVPSGMLVVFCVQQHAFTRI